MGERIGKWNFHGWYDAPNLPEKILLFFKRTVDRPVTSVGKNVKGIRMSE